jgi:hypothetical protein
MSSLPEALSAHLNGQLGLTDLVSSLQQSRKELAEHQAEMATIIEDIPDFLVAAERDDWLASFTTLDQRLSTVEEKLQDRKLIESLANDLTQMMDDLALFAMSLREAGWSARGPSSHSGVNELLYFMEQWTDDPTDGRLEVLLMKLDVEFTRLEHQFETYQQLPEFCAVAMEELLPELQALLQTAAQIVDLEEEELEDLFTKLEEWAASFLAYDIDFLKKRYSRVPTQIPTVNLALNSQLLFLEEIVTGEFVDYAVELAVETLQASSETFRQQQTLSDVDAHVYDELLGNLLSGLEEIPELSDKGELQEAGKTLIDLTGRFIQAHSRAETETGSRLDYKSEAE